MKVIFAESHNLDRPEPLGSHHYIRLFQETGHQCLWLGPAVSPLHLFKPDKANRRRFRAWREKLSSVGGIDWLVPLSLLFYYNLPLLRSLSFGRMQYRSCLPPIKKQLERAGFVPADLLWCAGPVALSLLDILPHRLSLYRLADRLDKFRRVPPNIASLQKELIERVDLVLVTSRSLLEWAGEVRSENVYYLPNGVSRLFFEPSAERPEDFPSSDRPVVVYAGTIDDRFDLEIFCYAVQKMDNLNFLLIGPLSVKKLKSGLKALQKMKNFTWLGPKNHELLPHYLQRCSAGIIPFHMNEMTEAVNPIKYYEYLAGGLPVVAPPMRELVETGGPLYTYRSPNQFCSALLEAVHNQERERASLLGFAAENTWEKRFEEVIKIIGSHGYG